MSNSIAECKAMCFLYDEIDPLIKAQEREVQTLVQPTINLLKINLKDCCNEKIENRGSFKNDEH